MISGIRLPDVIEPRLFVTDPNRVPFIRKVRRARFLAVKERATPKKTGLTRTLLRTVVSENNSSPHS